MKILVGLGNPGEKYTKTRHNLGFMVVDRLAKRFGVEVGKRQFKALIGKIPLDDDRLILVKPLTYMNHSGLSVKGVLNHYACSIDSLMVICDDLNLPLGRLRIRRKGSSGGHKGLESIIHSLGSTEFPRLRIGLGLPSQGQASEYVLTPFPKEETGVIDEALEQACKVVIDWMHGGIDECAKKYN
ncbi:MAG: aminoacyl-tRNA hydrolase [Planctomycetota bacterium]|jgi:PTH1 family peptidyl-tRNA hydrolase